jgi:hypothetical protein
MLVVYAKQKLPALGTPSIFLAGPTPRATGNPGYSWRPDALSLLEGMGFKGQVFIPEEEDGVFKGNYHDQTEWEREALSAATVIVFWVPRDLDIMPAFTTNVEFGYWVAKDVLKIVLGHPKDAPKTRYLDWLIISELKYQIQNGLTAMMQGIPETLEETLFLAQLMVKSKHIDA